MAADQFITQSLLLELLSYNPETGELIWKKRASAMFNETRQTRDHNAAIWNGRYAGKTATSIAVTGYRETSIFAVKVSAHRLIWMMVHGEWPQNIDHINGDRTDNRIANLRNVSTEENNRNLSRRVTNKSGCTGVYWVSSHGKWRASIGTRIIGMFLSKEAAIAARKAAEVSEGYHQNHGRR